MSCGGGRVMTIIISGSCLQHNAGRLANQRAATRPNWNRDECIQRRRLLTRRSRARPPIYISFLGESSYTHRAFNRNLSPLHIALWCARMRALAPAPRAHRSTMQIFWSGREEENLNERRLTLLLNEATASALDKDSFWSFPHTFLNFI